MKIELELEDDVDTDTIERLASLAERLFPVVSVEVDDDDD